MVIARFASHPIAANAANDPTSLPAYQAIAEYLMAQPMPETLPGGEWIVEDIDATGALLLSTSDGEVVTARRR